METLKEYNLRKRKAYQKLSKPHPNGIKCPKCGKELWDSNPNSILPSNPPQKNVHCPKCSYQGYAFC